MLNKNFSYASWNTTQSIHNALTSVNSLKSSVADDDYDSIDDIDKLERKLYQACKLALKIISNIEKAEGNENESH